MDIQKHQNGIRLGAGSTNIYINSDDEVASGVIVSTDTESTLTTTDERLIIEGPGEYEFKGIYIRLLKKNGILSATFNYNEREIYFTTSDGIESIPDGGMYDAVVVQVKPEFDTSKITNFSYPTAFLDSSNILEGKIEAEKVKNINTKKLTPEGGRMFILQ